jgi:DNA-binding NarL/FixJ family response regulator
VISVLIADDQDLVREGLRMMIEAEPDMRVVAEAGSGAEAITAARAHDPDVVLMDVRMPQIDGIEATRRLVAAGVRARVLMLTTFDLDEYVYKAMKSGASGFLLKDTRRDQLAAAIRAVAHGDQLLAPSITRRLIADFCARPDPSAVHQPADQLSARERDVILCIARGLSNAEVAAELYLAETTVKSHVARILAKLGLRDRVQIVVYAYETGLARHSIQPSKDTPA